MITLTRDKGREPDAGAQQNHQSDKAMARATPQAKRDKKQYTLFIAKLQYLFLEQPPQYNKILILVVAGKIKIGNSIFSSEYVIISVCGKLLPRHLTRGRDYADSMPR